MVWIIIISPLLGAILNGLILRPKSKNISHTIAVMSVLISFLTTVFLSLPFISGESETILVHGFYWISSQNLNIPLELAIDQLSITMVLIITGIGTLIHIYAGGYLYEETSTYRFFSYLNLFIFMMLLLVLGNNLLIMFFGWEGVGLCSYL